ncbi:MAG: hypothetical protein LBR17_06015 [Bacteroidales bacterium]|jgi:hypothetical protein|nr:hypothetical protein [Bacteroidales bacterium]
MNVEEILMKDKITETNPYSFARLEAKIEEKSRQYLPKKFSLAVRLAFCAVVLSLGANAYVVLSQDNSTKQTTEHDLAYQKFMSDNYYDVLANYYPEELLFE